VLLADVEREVTHVARMREKRNEYRIFMRKPLKTVIRKTERELGR
jgi:hypothetical protein